jgi:hypothetical protein
VTEIEAMLDAAPSREMAVGDDADQAVDTLGDSPDEAIVGRMS